MNAVNQNQQTAATESTKQAEGQKAHEARQAQQAVFLPKSDVVEREKAFHLFLEIPGVKKEHVELQLEKKTLTITGKLEQAKQRPTARAAIRSEYRVGNYERSFHLSDGIDKTDITAELKDGLLEVTLPKKPEAKPVQITVQ